ncbi:MAG: FAD/NAD(P)-binding oxidoreductase [Cytophagales bacterium]
MKKLVILGAGTAGTMMANHLNKELDNKLWQITIIDKEQNHYYQPGFLFIPFGIYEPKDVVKPIDKYIPKNVGIVKGEVDLINHENNNVQMSDGQTIDYDILVIATGSRIAPEEIDGMKGAEWHKSVYDFYTYEGAVNLHKKLTNWEGGKLVVHITEMPIKCPVAPLEFAFLADSYFKNKGMRDKVDITYVTPLDGAFTKPIAAGALGHLLEEKGIKIVPDFAIEHVDNENKKIVDYGESEVEFDLLVTIPTNMGDPLIERSGMGDELNFIPTNPKTLQSNIRENIFVIGDATNCPTSKAGSVAHFEAEVLTENIHRYIHGDTLQEKFDGHANCFVETGEGKALLIDFNYNQQPVEGTFPIPGIGPMKLLKETRMNHLGKLAFKWVYWNMLLKGTAIPFVSTNMQEAGKKIEN